MWGSNAYILAPLLTFSFGGDLEEEKYGVKYASNCEVCKVWIFLDQVSMSNGKSINFSNVFAMEIRNQRLWLWSLGANCWKARSHMV